MASLDPGRSTPEEIVSRVFGVQRRAVTERTSNRTLAQWDSLGHMTLMTALESVYGVKVSPEDALTMTDVGTIKRLLAERGVRW